MKRENSTMEINCVLNPQNFIRMIIIRIMKFWDTMSKSGRHFKGRLSLRFGNFKKDDNGYSLNCVCQSRAKIY